MPSPSWISSEPIPSSSTQHAFMPTRLDKKKKKKEDPTTNSPPRETRKKKDGKKKKKNEGGVLLKFVYTSLPPGYLLLAGGNPSIYVSPMLCNGLCRQIRGGTRKKKSQMKKTGLFRPLSSGDGQCLSLVLPPPPKKNPVFPPKQSRPGIFLLHPLDN